MFTQALNRMISCGDKCIKDITVLTLVL